MCSLLNILIITFALTVCASARRLTFNRRRMPIKIVETSYGAGNLERIYYLEAEIHPRHLTGKRRVKFPTNGPFETYYRGVREYGDERGHIVGAQFSGPPEWYNLTPQNVKVNRNSAYDALNIEWYGAECEVRDFLEQGGDRHVLWKVWMDFVLNSNRPDRYRLCVEFVENGSNSTLEIEMSNPFLRHDSNFWICDQCVSNRHVSDATRRRELIQSSCYKT